MANNAISQLEINGNTYNIADAEARSELSNVVKTNTANTFTNDNTFNGLVSITKGIINRGDSVNYSIKGTNTDLTQKNNGVSSTQYPKYLVMDQNNKTEMNLSGLIGASGNTGWMLKAQNYNTSGTLVADKGIIMFLDKTGKATWTVDNPENFRSAIGTAASSDRRLKTDLKLLDDDAVAFVKSLKPYVYTINGEKQVGLIAQDVHESDQWNTNMAFETQENLDGLDDWEKMEDGSPTWKLDYIRLLPPTITALQKAMNKIEELEQKITILEEKQN